MDPLQVLQVVPPVPRRVHGARVAAALEDLRLRGPALHGAGRGLRGPRDEVHIKIEYWMDNWTVSDVTGHAGVIGQYLANAIISDKSK